MGTFEFEYLSRHYFSIVPDIAMSATGNSIGLLNHHLAVVASRNHAPLARGNGDPRGRHPILRKSDQATVQQE